MKTFVVKRKHSAPAIGKARPYIHHPIGPMQQMQQAQIRRILRFTGAQSKLTIGQSNDKYEQESDRVADQVMTMSDPKLQRRSEDEEQGQETLRPPSLKESITTFSNAAPVVQRDIQGSHTFKRTGKFEADFKKFDGRELLDAAGEEGTIKYTPNANAFECSSIRFVQIARVTSIDKNGVEKDHQWVGSDAPINKMRTKAAKDVKTGFYVDQEPSYLHKRTKKSDPPVLPYYDVTGELMPENKIGKRMKGKPIEPAIIKDAPSSSGPGRFIAVSGAKCSNNPYWYGTVLWEFGVYKDDKGVVKVKDEKLDFQRKPDKTMFAAIKHFDQYYRNPFTANAPKK